MRRRLAQLGFAVFACAAIVGCAGLLGLDEVFESDPSGGEAGGDSAPDSETGGGGDGNVGADTSTDALVDGSADGDVDAATDADADVTVDAPVDAFDAGCKQKIAFDFTTNPPAGLATVVKDGSSTLVYDNTAPGGSRGMHVTLPVGGTNAVLSIPLGALEMDGAKECAVTCAVDVKIYQRGGAQEQTFEINMMNGGSFATLSHSSSFSYLSIGAGPDAPDLGQMSPGGATTRISMDVTHLNNRTAVGNVGGTVTSKQLGFFPATVEIGLRRGAGTAAIEVTFDNLVCASRLQ